jgi:hypothetical protein
MRTCSICGGLVDRFLKTGLPMRRCSGCVHKKSARRQSLEARRATLTAWMARPEIRAEQNRKAQARHLRRLATDSEYRERKRRQSIAAKAKRRRKDVAAGLSTHRATTRVRH